MPPVLAALGLSFAVSPLRDAAYPVLLLARVVFLEAVDHRLLPVRSRHVVHVRLCVRARLALCLSSLVLSKALHLVWQSCTLREVDPALRYVERRLFELATKVQLVSAFLKLVVERCLLLERVLSLAPLRLLPLLLLGRRPGVHHFSLETLSELLLESVLLLYLLALLLSHQVLVPLKLETAVLLLSQYDVVVDGLQVFHEDLVLGFEALDLLLDLQLLSLLQALPLNVLVGLLLHPHLLLLAAFLLQLELVQQDVHLADVDAVHLALGLSVFLDLPDPVFSLLDLVIHATLTDEVHGLSLNLRVLLLEHVSDVELGVTHLADVSTGV